MSQFTNPASAAPGAAAAYIAGILGLLGDRDPMEVLKATPGALGRALHSLPAGLAGEPEAPGKWSVTHVLQHLSDSDLVWGYRVRRVLSEERPVLTGYDQDLWAGRLRYADADAEEALEELAALRRLNLRLLRRVPAGDLERAGMHAERGEESLTHMIRLYAGHDLVHLRQIDRIAAKGRLGRSSQ
jgi:hypothetical protein